MPPDTGIDTLAKLHFRLGFRYTRHQMSGFRPLKRKKQIMPDVGADFGG
jgi:hypothetical protein